MTSGERYWLRDGLVKRTGPKVEQHMRSLGYEPAVVIATADLDTVMYAEDNDHPDVLAAWRRIEQELQKGSN